MPYFVYLIVTKDKSKKRYSYVGYTENIKKRLDLHNTNKGAKFTRGKKWKLVYYEKYDSKSDAMKNEYKLKKDRKKRNYIKSKFV